MGSGWNRIGSHSDWNRVESGGIGWNRLKPAEVGTRDEIQVANEIRIRDEHVLLCRGRGELLQHPREIACRSRCLFQPSTFVRPEQTAQSRAGAPLACHSAMCTPDIETTIGLARQAAAAPLVKRMAPMMKVAPTKKATVLSQRHSAPRCGIVSSENCRCSPNERVRRGAMTGRLIDNGCDGRMPRDPLDGALLEGTACCSSGTSGSSSIPVALVRVAKRTCGSPCTKQR